MFSSICRCHLDRVDANFGIERCLIGAVDTREILQRPASRLFVEAFHVTFFGNLKRRIDEDFDKLAFGHHGARGAGHVDGLARQGERIDPEGVL